MEETKKRNPVAVIRLKEEGDWGVCALRGRKREVVVAAVVCGDERERMPCQKGRSMEVITGEKSSFLSLSSILLFLLLSHKLIIFCCG